MWIQHIEEDDAEGILADLYEEARQASPRNTVPPMMKVLSLRPKVAVAKENLRRSLIGKASSLGSRRADMISVAVSGLNGCHF